MEEELQKKKGRSRRLRLGSKPKETRQQSDLPMQEPQGKLPQTRTKQLKCPRLLKSARETPAQSPTAELRKQIEEHKTKIQKTESKIALLRGRLKLHYDLASHNENYLQLLLQQLGQYRQLLVSKVPDASRAKYAELFVSVYAFVLELEKDNDFGHRQDFCLHRNAYLEAVSKEDWAILEEYARKFPDPDPDLALEPGLASPY